MAYKKEEGNAKRVQAWISHKQYESLERFAKMYKLPISRILAIAIENELLTDKPFKIDLKIPQDSLEYSYSNEAGKITNFMATLRSGITLDFLYVLRHDFGIPNRENFLAGFGECLSKNILEAYESPLTSKNIPGSTLYRLKASNPIVRKKVIKKAKTRAEKYEMLQKLKKEFNE